MDPRLQKRVQRYGWVQTYGEYAIDAENVNVDAATMKKLRSLGYVR